MKKIISYHPNKSTGIGGIETLVRSLQAVSKSNGNTFIEYYNDVANDKKEHFEEKDVGVVYKKIKLPDIFDGQIRELIKGMLFALRLLFNRNQNKDTVIIYHPIYLLFLFKFILSDKKLILVQSNRLDTLFLGRLVKLAFYLNNKNIYKFCVYTSYDKSKLEKSYDFDSQKIEVIPRGCKLESKNTIALFSKKLVTIARIHEHQKNFDQMIAAFKKLPSDYTLDIFGSGSDIEISNLKNKIKNMKNISYLGPTDNVAKTLSNYSVFLMTSQYEGFGQTLIEARSQGIPLVVFNNFEAAPWIVKDNENGFLVNNNNIGEFASKIQFLTFKREVFERFSNACLLMAKETENNKVEALWKPLLTK